ncbi:RDD family protein [Herbivorax sp. ANBcel31]|uniref:RDD family protein n=1 Tax=Herbivorax sp. ANBcel31 TaxID=3069754 RepID=UPI0027ADC1E3|nr:RDD family protein [Herbivorax sp. ANBcel31]MDQ2086594.1 RDD family protein [Herbivorax sp. ANBcel31]
MNNYRAAGFWVRFWAYILDIISISVLSSVAISIIVMLFGLPEQYLGWMKISFFTVGVIGFVYFTIMTRFWGQTIGKMICGIMVIRDGGKDLDWTTALVREVAGRTISQFFGSHIGYLIIPFVKKKRSCHDLLCDTYVVHVKELESNRWIYFNSKIDKNVINEFEIEHKKEKTGVKNEDIADNSKTDVSQKEDITSEDSKL